MAVYASSPKSSNIIIQFYFYASRKHIAYNFYVLREISVSYFCNGLPFNFFMKQILSWVFPEKHVTHELVFEFSASSALTRNRYSQLEYNGCMRRLSGQAETISLSVSNISIQSIWFTYGLLHFKIDKVKKNKKKIYYCLQWQWRITLFCNAHNCSLKHKTHINRYQALIIYRH